MRDLICVGLVALGLLVSTVDQGSSADYTIVPGQRIGSVRIGMSLDRVAKLIKVYGTVSGSKGIVCNVPVPYTGVCAADGYALGGGNSLKTPGKAAIIVTGNPRFKTAAGLTSLSTVPQFMAAYGKNVLVDPSDRIGYAWVDVGLMVGVERGTDKVVVIGVFPKRKK